MDRTRVHEKHARARVNRGMADKLLMTDEVMAPGQAIPTRIRDSGADGVRFFLA